MWWLIAAEAADPAGLQWRSLLDLGVAGVFIVMLLVGKWVVLRRELDACKESAQNEVEQIRSTMASLLTTKDGVITALEGQVKELSAKREELETFIRQTLLENQAQVLDRQMEVLQKLGRRKAGA